jgi:hypothetical protein
LIFGAKIEAWNNNRDHGKILAKHAKSHDVVFGLAQVCQIPKCVA